MQGAKSKFKTYSLNLLFGAIFFLSGCKSAPIQQMSDAQIALDGARRIQANTCSAKYFYMSEKTFDKGRSFLSIKDFVRAEEAFNNAKKYAERAELECTILKQK